MGDKSGLGSSHNHGLRWRFVNDMCVSRVTDGNRECDVHT